MRMTEPTKPLKPLPGLVARVRGAFTKPDREAAQSSEPLSNDDIVRRHWRDILARYMAGEAMHDIGKTLQPIQVTGAEIRRVFAADPELRQRMAAARQELSHHLFDAAVRSADKAERSGEYGNAINGYLKLAGTLNKADYGQRVSLEGNPESPIHVEHAGEVTHKVTPDEAYRQLLEGGR